MDLSNLKERVADSLVEEILRQAGYEVALIGRESRVQHLVKAGGDEFIPDLLAWKQVLQSGNGRPLGRLFAIEVKYRASISEYLQRDGHSDFSRAAEKWPDLYFILVTDRPEPDRSCFQVFDLRHYSPDTPLLTMDLHEAEDLNIYRATVKPYENLAKAIFWPLATFQPDTPSHKPAERAPARPSFLRDAG